MKSRKQTQLPEVVDAVVIGSGHNGLITAVTLAKAGWSVAVVERNQEIGGATRSGELDQPGLTHDLYATNINLFLASPAYTEWKDELEREGFRPKVSTRSYSNVFPDGKALKVYSDQAKTERLLGEHDVRDLEGWRGLHNRYKQFMTGLMPLYSTSLPSVRAVKGLVAAARSLGVFEMLELGRLLLASTRELGDTWMSSPEAKALIATWGMHLDYGPDVSGGAMFPFLETFTDMEEGIAVAEGGISALPEALAGMLEKAGGHIRTGTPVVSIDTEAGVATGVRLADGTRVHARRAVVANTTPTQLFGELLVDSGVVDAKLSTRTERYRYGPGTMVVHLALSEPITWAAGEELSEFAYVHVAPYVDDLARTYQQAMAGQIPDSPLLIVGQTSQVDPTRSPDDRQVVWVQVRALPSTIVGDAAGTITATSWDEAKEPVADRVIAKLEDYAPGIAELILSRTVFSPDDLEASNPNLVGGDSVAGSHHLWQNFLFRPWPGASTYRMPVGKLFLVGAATWPGAGTNGVSGSLCARRILDPHPYRGRIAAAIGTVAALATSAAIIKSIARR
ncbi:NAD(P)/FAD-dependent oxidoreductase [Herbiconiux sp. VKM Ac-2851]|uniref:phytoene desaturase family protein n=1 Tax=Herbiconiux sp. VKM Ac-2851 TaxID=2739025 RepID=UPI0015676897|nr:NAD(P)/FAD-dependent oxidoreductase [Herbiconiux sp. VKM Ac-2851]NQX37187.1 NAD(P)/FAD-dependent oxidoreductase [Herbiconiux sp. VKM Ac-2851]